MQEILKFKLSFIIENVIKLQKMIFKGKINLVSGSLLTEATIDSVCIKQGYLFLLFLTQRFPKSCCLLFVLFDTIGKPSTSRDAPLSRGA